MPRLIDHDERDRVIGDAAMRVLARDGLGALSVRKVAEEAGLATASLRRAFPTQLALRRYCVDRIHDAVAARVTTLTGEGLPLAIALLLELLPLDATRRDELLAQLQLGSLALTDATLTDSVRDLHDGVASICSVALGQLPLREDVDSAFETLRLQALLDGFALHLLWAAPTDAEGSARRLLEHHLSTLV
ncbi:TetR family transcriptional regulator C-terminal domain-containing protein [Microbacterium sp. CnD16-F]|uniref:TetR/AcrR family transcriptional regulator n=1 Tax=Microbacterium sp. CnD16-F TaxID=2954493 RepID=UPI002097B279|nr:TetR family transcriptional regulator C-terminal domain-containing protein [Microbacterium sp. CnD16-F]MCO7202097.1 TetR family transcriptional regulator C-terminal domain-containing protein [Microbacterium sp. CnD16-F]